MVDVYVGSRSILRDFTPPSKIWGTLVERSNSKVEKNNNRIERSRSKDDLLSLSSWDSSCSIDEIEEKGGRLGSKSELEDEIGGTLTEEQVQDVCLQRHGLFRYRILPDGNCLFRAVARALFGDQNLHSKLRHAAMEHISENILDFLTFFDSGSEDLTEYALREVSRLRKAGTWGGYESLMSLSNLYDVEFHIVMGGYQKSPTVSIHKCRNWATEQRRMVKKVFLVWTSLGHYDLALQTCLESPETQQWYKQYRDPPIHISQDSSETVREKKALRKVKSNYELAKLKSNSNLDGIVLKKFQALVFY